MRQATIEMENGKKVKIELYPNEAPKTVANFEKLVGDGFYNGLIFHRVIPGFMSQGGCPTGNGTGGPGYTIECETGASNFHKHEAGSLAMAHRGPNTGGSQFYICHAPQPHLDGKHTVFGKTVEGVDIVKQMKNGDRIKSIQIEEV